MKSFSKFLLFVLLISVGGAGVYSYFKKSNLLNVEPERRQPERATLAEGPKIDLEDVKILDAINKEYIKLIHRIVPSVVSITTTRTMQRPNIVMDQWGRVYRAPSSKTIKVPNSLGSGVIVSKEGHVVTNNHVISTEDGRVVDEIEVQLSNGETRSARLIDTDPLTDIAVLKVDGDDLEPLPFGDSDKVEVGERVFAVGNPYGFTESVSDGIISAKGRSAQSDNIAEFLQTNAAINPGNSGGPLINIRGEIVGINTMIASQDGGFQGIGLAVPSNTAKRVFDSIISRGRILRGWLGIDAMEWTPRLLDQLGLTKPEGALVAEVRSNSPAAKANIQPFDVIVKFNGKNVKDFSELRKEVLRRDIGEEVEIEIIREGNHLTVKTVIEEPPNDLLFSNNSRSPNNSNPMQPGPSQPGPVPRLNPPGVQNGPTILAGKVLSGVEVADLTPRTREQLGLPPSAKGVVIRSIPPESAAARELRVDDVIEEIDDTDIASVEDLSTVAMRLDQAKPHMVLIYRERARSFVWIRPS